MPFNMFSLFKILLISIQTNLLNWKYLTALLSICGNHPVSFIHELFLIVNIPVLKVNILVDLPFLKRNVYFDNFPL